jgi:diguanylate cyclase (GGDEF)-like protein
MIGVIAFYGMDDVLIEHNPALISRIKKYINPISIAINNSFLLTRIVDHAFMLEKKVSERTIELKKKNEELELLNNVTQKINSTLDLNEVLDLIHDELSKLFYFEGFGVMLVDETKNFLTTIKLEIPSLPKDAINDFLSNKIPLAFGKGGRVAASVIKKEDYYFENISLDNIKNEVNREAVIKTGGLKSALIIPIILNSESIGAMIFASYTKNLGYTQSDIQTLKRFVAQASSAIKNSFLHRDLRSALKKLDRANTKLKKQKRLLKELSVTDSLTDIKNRRYFDERITEEFEKSIRYSRPIYVILIDIDNFKSVNDTYGHEYGDYVLIEFVNIIRMNVRKSDLFARYGGEEFVIAMFETNIEGAKLVAEKIRSAAENHLYIYKNISTKRTVSIGISCFPNPKGEARDVDGVINEADEALYVAKNTGKNKWVYYYDYKKKGFNMMQSGQNGNI